MIHLRVWGDYACFTRPELKVERVSYPVMTPSAARGVLEAIYYKPQMAYAIRSIKVIKRGDWFNCRRNETTQTPSFSTVLSGADLVSRPGSSNFTQRGMLALAGVEYVISANILPSGISTPDHDTDPYKHLGVYTKRAKAGKCFHTPFLGCREFSAFFEPVDDPSLVASECVEWTEDLGLMLYDPFDPHERTVAGGKPIVVRPSFFDAKIRNGILDCHHEKVKLIRQPAA